MEHIDPALIDILAVGYADSPSVAGTIGLIRDGDRVIVVDPGMVKNRALILDPLERLSPGGCRDGRCARREAVGARTDALPAPVETVSRAGSATRNPEADGPANTRSMNRRRRAGAVRSWRIGRSRSRRAGGSRCRQGVLA